jgi:lactate dehydrogenase-like 2-hydroxyacid dehydrogenase
MSGQQRAAPAADRNSVPEGRVILSASVSNVDRAPAPRAKQDETTPVCGRRVGIVGMGNIEKVLALKFWHVFGRSTDDFPQLI